MAKYKLQAGSPLPGVIDTDRGAHIPNDSANTDWQNYQIWLTEGSPLNVPDAADVYVEDWDNAGRQLRNGMLTACDWTQLSDSPLSGAKVAEWATYRQELRDLPATYTDYSTVVWPTEPTA